MPFDREGETRGNDRLGTPRARESGAMTARSLLLAILLLGGCTSGSASHIVPPSRSPSAMPSAPSPAPALHASAPKRVREAVGNGELAHFADPERAAKIRGAAERLRAELERELAAFEAPGLAWGLVVDDELVLSAAHGQTSLEAGVPVSADTVFRIGSISKVFSALALVQLDERGAFSLDAPVEGWLPELALVVYPSRDAPLITARHLMMHRSGLPRLAGPDYSTADRPPSEAELLQGLDGLALVSVPGLSDLYSNFGASLLGPLITRVSGTPFREYIKRELLVPLGMVGTYWEAGDVPASLLARPHDLGKDGVLRVTPEWAMGGAAAAGGLYSSLNDMARFASFQLAAWPPSNRPAHRVLAAASLRETQSFQNADRLRLRSKDGEPPAASVSGSGLGWSVLQDCRFEHVAWHNGGTEGHHAVLYLLPARGVAVIALANSDEAELDGPVRRFLSRLHDANVLPKREADLALARPASFDEKVNAALALGKDFSPEGYARLFAPAFVSAVPPETFRSMVEGIYRDLGQCRVDAPLDSRHSTWVGAAIQCERGQRAMEGALSSDQFAGFWINTPEKYQARIAERVVEGDAACPAP